MSYWIFQSVIERQDLRVTLQEQKEDTRLASRYRQQMSPDDLVFFWLAGDEDIRGIYGWGILLSVCYAVKRCAEQAGIDNLAVHDLRRSCARLCHGCGGELEQTQFLLGHASVQTTERYIGCKQKLRDAVNDRLGISVARENA